MLERYESHAIMPAKNILGLIPLFILLMASCEDDPVVPEPPVRPPLVSGEIRIPISSGYTAAGTVDLRITCYGEDSCTVWNGEFTDGEPALRVALVDGKAEIEGWQLVEGEGMRYVRAGFGSDGAGFAAIAADSIVVDRTPPESAPVVEFPAPGRESSAPVTMLKWRAAVDALCPSDELEYEVKVYAGQTIELFHWRGHGTKTVVGGLMPGMACTWSVTARDAAGNRSEPGGGTFRTWPMPMPGFVPVAAGSFSMGEPVSNPFSNAGTLQHDVTLTTDFHMASTQVTSRHLEFWMNYAMDAGLMAVAADTAWHAEMVGSDPYFDVEFSYFTFDGTHFSHEFPQADDCISSLLNWYGATAFCDWLNVRAGLEPIYDPQNRRSKGREIYDVPGYRLATEAEWEYACRAGTRTDLWNGDLPAGLPVNCCPADPFDQSCCEFVEILDEIAYYCANWRTGSCLAATKPPNPWGLYDMHGGTADWIFDTYARYSASPVTDPVVFQEVEGERAMARGGLPFASLNYCWAHFCRSAHRETCPAWRDHAAGIRLVYSAGR